MPRPRDPLPFLAEPRTFCEARAAGIGRSRLASAQLQHPFHGVVQEPSENPVPDEFLERCRQMAVRMAVGQFLSHGTALRLIGAPVPRRHADEIHVSAYRPAREPRTRGVHGHRLQTREPRIIRIAGLPVEHPVRAWRQASAMWTSLALTQAGDHLVRRDRPWTTIEELRAELAVMGSTATARRALDDVRVGSESPRETELRLLLVAHGLPEPELNWELRDASGAHIARLDQAYLRERVGVEYDGRQHAEDRAQFARDADRWQAIQSEGWLLVRILNHHMAGDGSRAVALVRAALRSRRP
ncbi:hypothetical protein GCM10022219_27490 [Microbacterium oryzae]|uniref:DUF559 domain-containing protein n=1 Tax=Microbacterium oryzae TaxID=743009 RepID=A0A6I6DQF3_9MICO|nr:DUF559 domain-containing protein [Microbacterium oryzae]QGU26276.1 DUF559 domain-containing protein [Microbacterium oryzae]